MYSIAYADSRSQSFLPPRCPSGGTLDGYAMRGVRVAQRCHAGFSTVGAGGRSPLRRRRHRRWRDADEMCGTTQLDIHSRCTRALFMAEPGVVEDDDLFRSGDIQ